jgi:calpain-7
MERRVSQVERLYSEAFRHANEAKVLEIEGQTLIQAFDKFQLAISILTRLSIVESIEKRQLIQDALIELKERVEKIKKKQEYLIHRAIEMHEKAKQSEKENTNDVCICIKFYMQTAEAYLKAYHAIDPNDFNTKKVIKEQLEYVIDYVSALKQRQQQQESHDTMMRTFSTSTFSTSIGINHKFQEMSLHSSNMTTTTPSNDNLDLIYTREELDVLRRSSLINGHLFLPWIEEDAAWTLTKEEDQEMFTDPDGYLPLSAKQEAKLAVWIRPHEYTQLCQVPPPIMIDQVSPHVIKQNVVTDCSFVASLCIAAAFEKRFQKQLITSII